MVQSAAVGVFVSMPIFGRLSRLPATSWASPISHTERLVQVRLEFGVDSPFQCAIALRRISNGVQPQQRRN